MHTHIHTHVYAHYYNLTYILNQPAANQIINNQPAAIKEVVTEAASGAAATAATATAFKRNRIKQRQELHTAQQLCRVVAVMALNIKDNKRKKERNFYKLCILSL